MLRILSAMGSIQCVLFFISYLPLSSSHSGRCGTHGPDDGIRLHNWGDNFLYSTMNIQYPRTVAQVQQIVARSRRLRVLGHRHSFSKIADSECALLDTLGLNAILGVDPTVPSITVQPGILYTDLCPFIDYLGFALNNMAGLAELSVGGATQTGTHGSSWYTGNLATQVRALQLVLANGSVVTFGPDRPELKAMALGLGAFGVITQVELSLVSSFKLTNYVFVNLPSENLYEHMDEIFSMGYTVNMFTSMSNTSSWDHLWVNVRSDDVNNPVVNMTQLYGATRAYVQTPVVAGAPGGYFSLQGVEQPWYYGLIGYRLGLSGADSSDLQTEYFVPHSQAVAALKAVTLLVPTLQPLMVGMAFRMVKSDDLWMSQTSGIGTNETHFMAIHLR